MTAQISFKADVKTLKDVLFSNRRYRVPRYQRPYAWGIEEVSELWEDIVSADESHFLGSFIFNTGGGPDCVEIIDGQQRLLTITMMGAVLRDHAKAIAPEKAEIYQRQDIAIENRDGTQSFRVLPADSIRDYFERHIQDEGANILSSSPTAAEEKRLKENYLYLHSAVSEALGKRTGETEKMALLDELRGKIEDIATITIEISNEEDAYEIFETTNARGLELSVADLLKNLIFKNIRAREDRDFAKEVWEDIIETVESTGTDIRKFIRYYWISKYRFLPEKRLYREIKGSIKGWEELLGDLQTNSSLHHRLLKGSEQDLMEIAGMRELKQSAAKIYGSVFALRLMGVSQCYVFLLAVLRNLGRLGTNPTRAIQAIENFSFQYSAVCKLPTNRVENVYSRHAISIERALEELPQKQIPAKVQQILAKLESELKELAPSPQTFFESFEEVSYRSSEASRLLVKYILDRFNRHLQKTDENKPDFNTVNIEHILARTPKAGSGISKAEIKAFVNRLGNLTLLSRKINSRLQNVAPAQKLSELEKSELAITKEVVRTIKESNGTWGKAEIADRQKLMAERAFWQIWPVKK